MKFVFLFLLIFVFFSCSEEEKSRIEGGKLTVFFSPDSAKDEAKKVALFWKENKFLTGEKQDLQLDEFSDEFHLKIIENKSVADIEMPIEQLQHLYTLTDSLNSQIFIKKPVTIHVCDQNFKPKYAVE